ncbi:dna excision repair protein ercc-6-like protein [Stylonychia lemnae]|uniref:Dna excision repair protein ercc-6-like protein n=1 Tax=Stylonychia lemnae TaxID=5949 RepID=A0A078AFV0_STYLE|nr:dna excision repair protein ercc-6-like protein [Stylonychia lemnae]|eukprot:CDW81150.1 dna excision repair protein ercc-6-like protein [Stylonychia lemnae]
MNNYAGQAMFQNMQGSMSQAQQFTMMLQQMMMNQILQEEEQDAINSNFRMQLIFRACSLCTKIYQHFHTRPQKNIMKMRILIERMSLIIYINLGCMLTLTTFQIKKQLQMKQSQTLPRSIMNSPYLAENETQNSDKSNKNSNKKDQQICKTRSQVANKGKNEEEKISRLEVEQNIQDELMQQFEKYQKLMKEKGLDIQIVNNQIGQGNNYKKDPSNKLRAKREITYLNDQFIHDEHYVKLFDYQVKGVKWLYENYKKAQGCIVADDMGLGKTIQICVLIGNLLLKNEIQDVVIVCPTSIVDYWKTTIKQWNLGLQYKILDIRDKGNRLEVFSPQRIQNCPEILIVSPKIFENQLQNIQARFDIDMMIIDEGHRAKNVKTMIRKSFKSLQVKQQKIILTGTPVQNNLEELYSLYDLVQDGKFGEFFNFKRNYSFPIEQGSKNFKNIEMVTIAREKIRELKSIYAPFFLRRVKKQIFKIRSAELNPIQEKETVLPLKTDMVVWVTLSDMQKEIYELILNSEVTIKAIIKNLVKPNKSMRHYLGYDNKRGLKLREKYQKFREYLKKIKEDEQGSEDENQKYGEVNKSLQIGIIHNFIESAFNINKYSDWINHSNKIKLLFELLESLHQNGNRVLIFTKSIILLDLIENTREYVCNHFNENGTFCFLLSSKVAGLGLNLTRADRAIILDPDWNPANDNQCIDRLYRIGQRKDVIVYRFICVGSVEEHMYRSEQLAEILNYN